MKAEYEILVVCLDGELRPAIRYHGATTIFSPEMRDHDKLWRLLCAHPETRGLGLADAVKAPQYLSDEAARECLNEGVKAREG